MSIDEILPRPMVLEEFTPLVGKTIIAECLPKDAELELIEASPLKDYGLVERPPFILIYQSDPKVQLQAGTYALRCGSNFGPAAVYLEPMTPAPGAQPGNYYQSVFN